MDCHQLLVQFATMKAISLKNKRVKMEKYVKLCKMNKKIALYLTDIPN